MTEPCEDDWLTLLAIGAAAASLAAFAHEAAGHATGCLLIGGRVMLLTSINFRCQVATWVTDAAGPIGNLLPAVGALVLLRLRAAWTAPTVDCRRPSLQIRRTGIIAADAVTGLTGSAHAANT